jgi:hypothetical protein
MLRSVVDRIIVSQLTPRNPNRSHIGDAGIGLPFDSDSMLLPFLAYHSLELTHLFDDNEMTG